MISADGYIADSNGKEDFIPDEVWNDFLELCKNYEAVVFGKDTYNIIQSFNKELVVPFEELNITKVVVTRDDEFKPKAGYLVLHSPKDVSEKFSNILLTSGPKLNSSFYKDQLIDTVILNELPVSLGAGIPQFESGALPHLLSTPGRTLSTGKTLKTFIVGY